MEGNLAALLVRDLGADAEDRGADDVRPDEVGYEREQVRVPQQAEQLVALPADAHRRVDLPADGDAGRRVRGLDQPQPLVERRPPVGLGLRHRALRDQLVDRRVHHGVDDLLQRAEVGDRVEHALLDAPALCVELVQLLRCHVQLAQGGSGGGHGGR